MTGATASSLARSGGGVAAASLQAFLPPGMAGCLDEVKVLDEPLHAEETPGTERMVPTRLREYVAGRTAAHRAIRDLTGKSVSVPKNPDRSPAWPEGLCGSLSHSRRYALCVVANLAHHQAIGVDIEEDSRLEEDLWDQVMTKTERTFLDSLPRERAVPAATLLFSAKEAYYKCLAQCVAAKDLFPEPNRVETSIDFDAGTLFCLSREDKSLPIAEGRFLHFDWHWITLFYVLSPTAHSSSSLCPQLEHRFS
ncbi:MAG: 4'-phosphopantetheinyl transferase superfamily protein [Opitutaceae bacterium]|nr:4'-phosphopantetheinyl transferase superfamily protein [Opitutaceae bacterium]